MPTGYRNVLAALAGLAALVTVYGLGLYSVVLNHPEQERYQSYRYASDKPQEIDPATTAESPHRFEYRAPCSQPKGKDESDLCAQWKAARAAEGGALWAERGFWVSFGSLALSVGGLAALLITISQGREANEISRISSEMDHRPWVAIRDFVVTNIDVSPERVDIRWRCTFENTGNTPALNLIPIMRLRAKVEEGQQLHFLQPEKSWQEQASYLYTQFDGVFGQAIFPGNSPVGNYGSGATWEELLLDRPHAEKVEVGVEFGVIYGYGSDRIGMTWFYVDVWDDRSDTIYLPRQNRNVPEAFIKVGMGLQSKAV